MTTTATDLSTFKFRDGTTLPSVAFGTGTALFKGLGKDCDVLRANIDLIKAAIEVGYTHLDTAQVYGTEAEVGTAINESGVDRSDLFITTKIWPTHHIDKVRSTAEEQLKRLGLDYVDLYLIHIPERWKEGVSLVDGWKAVEALVTAGLAKHVGVSNFRVQDFEQIFAYESISVYPEVNQIELNPYLVQPKLEKYCAEKGIHITAYAPLNPLRCKENESNPLFEGGLMDVLSKKYNTTPALLLLRWTLQRGNSLVTLSSKRERLVGSLKVSNADHHISVEDMQSITETGGKTHKRSYNLFLYEDE
eukprot:TRINITY_DN2087_c6_g1_i2.p1 TRINITY_DN2087_c6_g1~~TRINITY_DN2087_c6_g1_i2.p1  ORF type:complete len:305 (-),score=51.52 TRINITY_DN2087_c6_g1_i2:122-1036(-)